MSEHSFTIRCNSCGEEIIIAEGERKQEKITFGTDRIEDDYIICECGNRLVSEERWIFADEEDEGTLINRWNDESWRVRRESEESA